MKRFLPAWMQTPLAQWLLGALLISSLCLSVARLPAQESSSTPAAGSKAALATDSAASPSGEGSGDVFGASECHPPSTQEWVFIGLGTLVVFIVSFLLLVRLIQRYYIRRDKNATFGRHLGITVTFFVSSLGMSGVAYLVTGCLHRQFWVWLCFPLALGAIYLIYTLAVHRNE
jgi:hypothetical protein